MKNLLRCVPLLLALAACTDEALTDYVVTDGADLPVKATWNATLSAIGPRPQAAGTLKLDEYGSYMLLALTEQGLHPDSTYQWRLYFGTCAARIVAHGPNASPPAYRPFTADASGAGSSEATVMSRLKADSLYSIRVFIPRTISQTQPLDTTWYSCGNLQKS
jgi:hypothetical protein